MFSAVKLVTTDGIIFERVGDIIHVDSNIGGYRKSGDYDYFFYAETFDISKEDKLKFENKVNELIREVNMMENKVES